MVQRPVAQRKLVVPLQRKLVVPLQRKLVVQLVVPPVLMHCNQVDLTWPKVVHTPVGDR